MKELEYEYYCFLKGLIGERRKSKYEKLLQYLYSKEFTYLIDLDGNRYADGIELRYRFGYETGIPDARIASELDVTPCSVLEMMIALAARCEDDIMFEPDIGNRTRQWFFDMLNNMGLIIFDDIWFEKGRVEEIVERFLERRYEPDGRGGLFRIDRSGRDLRCVEIWVQAMWYLDEVIDIEESERR